MPTRPGSLILAPILVALCACATGGPQVLEFRDERVGSCTDGKACELAGVITLQSEPGATAASIDQVQGTCVPLLVPATLPAHGKHWDGKRVRVTGTALARSRGPVEVTRVRYRDRWLVEGSCGKSDIVVYVEQWRQER